MANERGDVRVPEALSLFASPSVALRPGLAAEVVAAELRVLMPGVHRALKKLESATKVSQEALQLVIKV